MGKRIQGSVKMVLWIIIFLVTAGLFWMLGAQRMAAAIKTTYSDAKEQAKQSVYDSYYQASYEKAEAKYHVSNRVEISVSSVREQPQLEVLKSLNTKYEFSGPEDNENGLTAWLEVPVEGIFTVDLSVAEFLVDNDRQFVRVRVPKPELRSFSIDYPNVKKLLFDYDSALDRMVFDKSYTIGIHLAQTQLTNAYVSLRDEMACNQDLLKRARSSAELLLKSMIAGANPEVPGLTVEVEFF